jgi:hypothetical protein
MNRSPARLLAVVLLGVGTLFTGLAPAQASDPYAGAPIGTLVDSHTGAAVPGVNVTFYTITNYIAGGPAEGTVTTDSAGHYVGPYIDFDEIVISYDGSTVHYESGYWGCADEIVATFGDACTTSPSAVLTTRIDRHGKPTGKGHH